MLNVGPLELVVVLAIALIVVGPERLPSLARSVGRALRQFRDVQNEVRDMVSAGLDDEVRDATSEFRRATASVRRATDVKGAVRRAQRGVRDELNPARPRPARSSASGPASTESPPPAVASNDDTGAEPDDSARP